MLTHEQAVKANRATRRHATRRRPRGFIPAHVYQKADPFERAMYAAEGYLPGIGGGAGPRASAAQRSGSPGNPAGVVIPFSAAAHEHTEWFLDTSVTPGAGAVLISPLPEVPAYGYVRNVYIQVDATGGTLGAGVLSADYPQNLFDLIQLEDVNGAPIFGPMNGFQTLQANILGGYAGISDPRRGPGYVSTINASFALRVPIEISHRDGFGALANQNSASTYKLRLRVNPSSVLYSTAPTTVPAFRIRAALEAWSLPDAQDVRGRPQMQLPPAHGTTQYWSAGSYAVAAGGQQRIPVQRVGNLIRILAFIARTAAGARSDAVFPDPVTLSWDARDIRASDPQAYLNQDFFESINGLNNTATYSAARDAGVFAYLFNTADHNLAGDDPPTLWLPTVQSSRIEVRGTVVTAGNVEELVNDIAPAEVNPAERYVEQSATGFTPTPTAGVAR